MASFPGVQNAANSSGLVIRLDDEDQEVARTDSNNPQSTTPTTAVFLGDEAVNAFASHEHWIESGKWDPYVNEHENWAWVHRQGYSITPFGDSLRAVIWRPDMPIFDTDVVVPRTEYSHDFHSMEQTGEVPLGHQSNASADAGSSGFMLTHTKVVSDSGEHSDVSSEGGDAIATAGYEEERRSEGGPQGQKRAEVLERSASS